MDERSSVLCFNIQQVSWWRHSLWDNHIVVEWALLLSENVSGSRKCRLGIDAIRDSKKPSLQNAGKKRRILLKTIFLNKTFISFVSWHQKIAKICLIVPSSLSHVCLSVCSPIRTRETRNRYFMNFVNILFLVELGQV
jgi:hypothetical protein